MKAFKVLFAVALLASLSACVSSQKETVHTQKEQIVEFSEAEVPYIQVTKKNGKISTDVITPSNSQITANK